MARRPDYHQLRLARGRAHYHKALDAVQIERDRLRDIVLEAKADNMTTVEIAAALDWSRQSVYDLIGKST